MAATFSKQSVIILVLLTLILFLAGWFTYRAITQDRLEESPAGVALFGDGTEGYRYTTLEGKEVALEAYLGKVLYINTWASWSPLSGPELLQLHELAGEYADRDIVFLALNRKETSDQATRFIAGMPPLTNVTLLIDTADHFYGAVGGYAMPETVVFDAAGDIIVHERTPQTKEQMRSIVEAALAQ